MSSNFIHTPIGFIGAGQMAQALARGFVAAGKAESNQIHACDPSVAARDAFADTVAQANVHDDPTKIARDCDVVFLAVKPQHIESVFEQLKRSDTSPALFVSIIAGVTLQRLATGLSSERIIRVMPNTPCLIGAGAAGFSVGAGAHAVDAELVHELLHAVGMAFQLPEPLLDAVTGLSGSGPAFVYQVIEALSDGGVRAGLPRDVSTKLAAQTVFGAAKMVLDTEEHPSVLKDRVASPGGTTIAGLHALESGGLRGILIDAVQAATNRSKELG